MTGIRRLSFPVRPALMFALLVCLSGSAYSSNAQTKSATNSEPLMLEITDLDGPPVYAGINDSSPTTITITTKQQFAFWRRPGATAGAPSALKLVCRRNGD